MAKKLKVDIFHNVLWAKYKGDIFKELLAISEQQQVEINIFQIAETELSRLSLGKVNPDDHQYRYQLLFDGPYELIKPWSLARRLIQLLLQSQSQVVVLPGYHRLEHWLMLLVSKLKSKQVLVFCDSTALDNKKTLIKDIFKMIFFRSVDGILSYGTSSANYVRSYIPKEQYSKVYFPCSSASLPNENYEINELVNHRQNLMNANQKAFLFVGRLSTEKGIIDLLEAWSSSETLRSNHILKLAGDGPLKVQLKDKIAQLGLEQSVQLLGACSKDELNLLYKNSFAMVLPSYSEPWGLVVNEAYYFGCPVIMSEQCGCHLDLCIDHTIQSFPQNDVLVLKMLMENLLNIPSYVALSAACKNVIRSFTPNSAATHIFEGIQESSEQVIRL